MKLLGIRWVLLIFVTAAGIGGVVSSNVGCGSDDGAKAGSGGGGSSGGGTSGGGTGGAVSYKLSYTFDTATSADATNWKLNDYIDGVPAKNLGAYMKADAGLTLAEPPTMEWSNSDSENSTTSGSMKVSVTFYEYGQNVEPVINLNPVVDLSNSVVSLRIRLVSGTFTGGTQFHISTGQSYQYWAGAWTNGVDYVPGTWKTLPIDTAIKPMTTDDPSMVIQIGIQISAGSAPDGGGTPPSGRLVFEIDTVRAQ